jgi:hypothetical protein
MPMRTRIVLPRRGEKVLGGAADGGSGLGGVGTDADAFGWVMSGFPSSPTIILE